MIEGAVRPIREADENVGELMRRVKRQRQGGLSHATGAPEPNERKLEDEEEERKVTTAEGIIREENNEEQHENQEKNLEEATKPKTLKTSKGPSKKERDEHNATHMPFRDWCRHCVRGRAKNKAHKNHVGDDDGLMKVPRISMDYFFMNKEDERASQNPLVVMIDESSGARYMRASGRKGIGENGEMEWLIKDMHEELKSWGHPGGGENRLIFKSDGEPAMKALRETLAKYHGGVIIPEQSPTGESQCNGKVEEAGKTIRNYVKTLKDQMEYMAGIEVSPGDVVMQWLVRWAAMMYTRFMKGSDGRTAYERQKGRRCQIEVVPFGERVMYKRLGDKKSKLESEYEDGIWLGHSRHTNEVLVGTKSGVVRAYAVRRMPEGERWDGHFIKELKGTPQKPDPNAPGNDLPI